MVAEALDTRTEPIVFAGDKFKQAKAGVIISTLQDSFELHEDELGTIGDAGSNFNDFLLKNTYKQLKNIFLNCFVIFQITCIALPQICFAALLYNVLNSDISVLWP